MGEQCQRLRLFLQSQEYACMHSLTLVVDEDVSRQVTLTREGEVLIGINQAASLPYSDGTPRPRPFTPEPGPLALCLESHGVSWFSSFLGKSMAS